jgi:hypothetical protein
VSPDRTRLLCEQFPALVSQGLRFECGDGWFALLQKLFAALAEHANAHKMPATVVSVREKYGSLRVETSEEDRHIRRLLHDAEEASETICDICGAPGTLFDDGIWITTRCRWHARR